VSAVTPQPPPPLPNALVQISAKFARRGETKKVIMMMMMMMVVVVVVIDVCALT